jgi:hypothetical protein
MRILNFSYEIGVQSILYAYLVFDQSHLFYCNLLRLEYLANLGTVVMDTFRGFTTIGGSMEGAQEQL